jgi:hypothetical protein
MFMSAGLLLCAFLFSACPTGADDDNNTVPDPVISLTGSRGELELVISDGDIKFFDFADGTEVKDAAIKSRKWDIAFWATRLILTNSGVSADEYRSSGRGAVWHTEKTDFGSATLEDAVNKDKHEGDEGYDPDYAQYNEDVLRYATGMTGYYTRYERFMNVMTYLGYPNEAKNPAMDGTTMVKRFEPMYLYNKRAFYEATVGMMPPDFRPTYRVYIIRHGDGEHYSKFQVTKFERDSFHYIDTYKVIWENF